MIRRRFERELSREGELSFDRFELQLAFRALVERFSNPFRIDCLSLDQLQNLLFAFVTVHGAMFPSPHNIGLDA
jgi:hypothetical protein